MPRFPTAHLKNASRLITKTSTLNKPILRLAIDGSVLRYPKHITVNSELLVSAMRELKESDLVPGKGLTIMIKNVC